jgi:hypothetical protein
MERSVPAWLRHIQIEWALEVDQLAQMLHIDPRLLEKSLSNTDDVNGPTIPQGLETAAPFIGIYRKLAARFPKSEDQVKWLFTEHQEFGGTKPIDVAASSVDNLYWVAYFLESQSAAKSAE